MSPADFAFDAKAFSGFTLIGALSDTSGFDLRAAGDLTRCDVSDAAFDERAGLAAAALETVARVSWA